MTRPHLIGDSMALRFILPDGWVRVTPWTQQGDFFASSHPDYFMYGSAGVGRFELYKESIRGSEVTIGIHENASNFASVAVEFQSVWTVVQAADSWLRYDWPFSIAIGIPPLGTNETAWRSMYAPATNFPPGFTAALSLVNDIEWVEGRWLGLGISSYFDELILYKSGAWSRDVYKANLDYKKNLYLNEVYGTIYDLPIPDLESRSDPEYRSAKDAKFYLFLYILDYEVRRVTSGEKTLTDVMVCWRQRFAAELTCFTDAELLEELNTCTGNDFTDFFNKYYYGTEKYPVEIAWAPLSQQIYLPIILK